MNSDSNKQRKTIGLVAHDHRKGDLIDWVEWNYLELIQHDLVCTGTTGRLVKESLTRQCEKSGTKFGSNIRLLRSGPLGGDQQLGALISEGGIDLLIFFWDPMAPQPHEVDVKALLRIAVVYNVPTACNRSTADYIISSPLMQQGYVPAEVDYSQYLSRDLNKE